MSSEYIGDLSTSGKPENESSSADTCDAEVESITKSSNGSKDIIAKDAIPSNTDNNRYSVAEYYKEREQSILNGDKSRSGAVNPVGAQLAPPHGLATPAPSSPVNRPATSTVTRKPVIARSRQRDAPPISSYDELDNVLFAMGFSLAERIDFREQRQNEYLSRQQEKKLAVGGQKSAADKEPTPRAVKRSVDGTGFGQSQRGDPPPKRVMPWHKTKAELSSSTGTDVSALGSSDTTFDLRDDPLDKTIDFGQKGAVLYGQTADQTIDLSVTGSTIILEATPGSTPRAGTSPGGDMSSSIGNSSVTYSLECGEMTHETSMDTSKSESPLKFADTHARFQSTPRKVSPGSKLKLGHSFSTTYSADYSPIATGKAARTAQWLKANPFNENDAADQSLNDNSATDSDKPLNESSSSITNQTDPDCSWFTAPERSYCKCGFCSPEGGIANAFCCKIPEILGENGHDRSCLSHSMEVNDALIAAGANFDGSNSIFMDAAFSDIGKHLANKYPSFIANYARRGPIDGQILIPPPNCLVRRVRHVYPPTDSDTSIEEFILVEEVPPEPTGHVTPQIGDDENINESNPKLATPKVIINQFINGHDMNIDPLIPPIASAKVVIDESLVSFQSQLGISRSYLKEIPGKYGLKTVIGVSDIGKWDIGGIEGNGNSRKMAVRDAPMENVGGGLEGVDEWDDVKEETKAVDESEPSKDQAKEEPGKVETEEFQCECGNCYGPIVVGPCCKTEELHSLSAVRCLTTDQVVLSSIAKAGAKPGAKNKPKRFATYKEIGPYLRDICPDYDARFGQTTPVGNRVVPMPRCVGNLISREFPDDTYKGFGNFGSGHE